MANHLLIYALLIVTLSKRLSALVCMECEPDFCEPVTNCGDSGVVKDPCNCCDVCAKKKGQACGGPWDIAGKCGPGMRCVSLSMFPVSGVCVPE